jgi:hypothetical protein
MALSQKKLDIFRFGMYLAGSTSHRGREKPMNLTPTKLTEEEVLAQNERSFNWSLRTGVQLSSTIIADARLKHHFPEIKHVARSVAKESSVALLKFEAIPGTWELDNNYSSVILRWTSSEGTFTMGLPSLATQADLDLFDNREYSPHSGPYVQSPFNPYKPRPGQTIAKGL